MPQSTEPKRTASRATFGLCATLVALTATAADPAPTLTPVAVTPPSERSAMPSPPSASERTGCEDSTRNGTIELRVDDLPAGPERLQLYEVQIETRAANRLRAAGWSYRAPTADGSRCALVVRLADPGDGLRVEVKFGPPGAPTATYRGEERVPVGAGDAASRARQATGVLNAVDRQVDRFLRTVPPPSAPPTHAGTD